MSGRTYDILLSIGLGLAMCVVVLMGAVMWLLMLTADDPPSATMDLSGIRVPAGLEWEFDSGYYLATPRDVVVDNGDHVAGYAVPDTVFTIMGYGRRP